MSVGVTLPPHARYGTSGSLSAQVPCPCGEPAPIRPELSVVVPCFNEGPVLRALVKRLTRACNSSANNYDIILVNDGSTDSTWAILEDMVRSDARIVAVNLSRNHGHQLALSAGLSLARGQRVLIIDADLQDPPELLPDMLRLMEAGADVVYGRRRRREGEGPIKRLTATLFYRLLGALADVPIPRDTGDFRLISRRALDVLLAMPERHRFLRGMVCWIGLRQEPIYYDRHARTAGVTKYPLRKMIRLACDAITSFSVRPLAVASWVGIASGLCSTLILMYSLVSWLGGRVVTGWTSVMATVTLLGAIQLIVLGIMGEYLGRLYEQSKQRPLFVIERVIRSGSDNGGTPTHDL